VSTIGGRPASPPARRPGRKLFKAAMSLFLYTRACCSSIQYNKTTTATTAVYIITISGQIHVYLWTGTNFVYVYKIMIGFKFWRGAEETEEEEEEEYYIYYMWTRPLLGPKWNLTNDCNSSPWRTKTIVQQWTTELCVCVCRPGEHQNFNTINDWFIAFGSYRFSTPALHGRPARHNYR